MNTIPEQEHQLSNLAICEVILSRIGIDDYDKILKAHPGCFSRIKKALGGSQ